MRNATAEPLPGAPVGRVSVGTLAGLGVLLLVLALTPRVAHAVTYYVNPASSQASDSGPGTATQPYRTISAAVAARGGPGNTIVVAPAVYREQVTVGASGASGNPFVLQASGPGAVIDGADDLGLAASWKVSSGNVWLAAGVTWSPKQVFANGVRLAASSGSVSSLPANTFRWVSSRGLYVNVGGANPGTRQIRVGRRSYGFRVSGRSWVTIDGFSIVRAEDRGIYISSGSNQCIASRDSVSLSVSYGIAFSGATGGRITASVVSGNLGHGIYLSSSTTGVLVDANEVRANGTSGTSVHGVALSSAPSNRIERNRITGNFGAGIQLSSSSNNCALVANRLWQNAASGVQISGSTGVRSTNDVAWKNARRGFSFESSATGGKLFNAIAVDNGIAASEFDLNVDANAVSAFSSNDNVIWNSTAQAPVRFNGVVYSTLAALAAATGNDTRSAAGDPRFVQPQAGDFHLLAGSPAIDAANSSVVDWAATDAEGNARKDDPAMPNTGPGPVAFGDRGALEFTPSLAGPIARLTVTPSAGEAPLDVQADASTSTPQGSPLASYRFDFGDGTVIGPQSGPVATHRYAAGSWTVTVTVLDQAGSGAVATAGVVATVANQRPTAALGFTLGSYEGLRALIVDPIAVFTPPRPPRPGYLVSWTDPVFGTTITRMGGDTGTPLGNGVTGTWGSDARHHYSKDEPWNADGTLIVIENSGSPGDVYLDGESYRVVPGPCANYNQSDDRWHPTNPRVRINVNGSELSWFDVVQCVKLRSWTLPFAADYFGHSEGNPSRDGRFAAMSDGRRVFVVDMDPQPPFAPYPAQRIGPTYDYSSCGLPDCSVGWVSISPSGKYLVVKHSGDHPRVFDVDPQTLAITPHALAPASPRCVGTAAQGFLYDLGHSDMTLDPFDQNEDVLIGQEHCGWKGTTVAGQLIGGVVMVRLRDGAITALTDPTNEASPHHVSARNIRRPGWAYVSYRSNPGQRFSEEVIAVKIDGSKQVERFAHEHSLVGAYRTEVHAVPSPDGTRVMFASNWALDCSPCASTSDIKSYVIDARASVGAGSGAFQQNVAFDASGSRDPDGQVAAYRFDFGDGSVAGPQTWPSSSHTYATGTWIAKVVVTDDRGGMDSTTVTLDIHPPPPPDHAPVVIAPASTLALAGDSVIVQVSAADPDGDAIAAIAAGLGALPPAAATFEVGAENASGRLVWPTHEADARQAPYLVTFTASNAKSGSDSTWITVTQAPVLVAPDTVRATEGVPLSFTVTASDPDADAIAALTADLTGLPAPVTATFSAQPAQTAATFAWTPSHADARVAPYPVVIVAHNAFADTDTVWVAVDEVDRAPVVSAPSTFGVQPGETVEIAVSASDPDGDPIESLAADLLELPANGDASFVATTPTSGVLTWHPVAADARATAYHVTFTARNALASSATTAIGVSRPPTVSAPDTVRGAENAPISFTVTAGDPEGDAIDSLVARLVPRPTPCNARVIASPDDATSGVFTWTPTFADGRAAPYAAVFEAWNARSGLDTTWIVVAPVDRPPTVSAPASASVTEGQVLTIQVTASDPDADPLAITADLSGLPVGATFTDGTAATPGVLRWTPGSNDGRAAPYTVTFRAANALAATASTQITVADASVVNLIGNPSFETNTSGWNVTGTGTLARVEGGYSGAWSARLTAGSTSEFGLNDSPSWVTSTAAAGTRYRYTAQVRAAGSVNGGRARLKVRIYRSGTQVGSTIYSTTLTLSPSWQPLTVDVVSLAAGDALDIQVFDLPLVAGESFLVDDVSIVIVPASAASLAPTAMTLDFAARASLPGLAASLSVVPHPVRGASVLRLATEREGSLDVRLFDAQGREVARLAQIAHATRGWHELPIGAGRGGKPVQPGLYFVRVRSAGTEVVRRVVVME